MPDRDKPDTLPSRFAALLAVVMECLVLFLVLFSAWPFGSVHAFFQWILFGTVACLLGCWAARLILKGRARWTPCPIALGLAGLCLLALLQGLPLPARWVQILSPETAALHEFLRPVSEETAAPLSLTPGETRRRLLQLIAVLAVFVVVRNNLRSPGCLRRLAWLCAANGVLLTLLGLGQMASSSPHTVFWTFPTLGQVFGPFICRNHFAYYLNLCLGLTVGLLLGTSYFVAESRQYRTEGLFPWRELFQDARVLWLVSALAIMLTGLFACLSRGGVLGLAVGGLLGLVLLLARSGVTRWGAGVLVFGLTALLLAWLGHDRVSARWEKLFEDNSQSEARATVWARVLPLTARFPLFGTGLGSFGLIEPSMRRPGDPANLLHDHAHNDYLELWIEGGASQLLLAGLVLFLVLRQGIRAFFRHGTTDTARLALGGLVGCTAVIVHSFVDFGLHVPAVTLLFAVVAALLANLAEPRRPPSSAILRLGGSAGRSPWPACLLQVAALLAVALLLLQHGRAEEQAERYRLASRKAPTERRIDYLRTALVFAPDRADLHLDLADALLGRWQYQQLRWAPVVTATSPAPNLPLLAVLSQPPARRGVADADLQSARQHVAHARQLSPLHLDALEKEMRLAGLFAEPADRDRAIERLLRVSPSDPAPRFWAGHRVHERGEAED
jgi:O-antigen ligase